MQVVIADIEQGGIVKIRGRSGAGKTEFSKHNMMLLDETGEIQDVRPVNLKPGSTYSVSTGSAMPNVTVID